MKRFICFAAVVALLGGLAILPLVNNADAQSNVQLRPFTNMYYVHKVTVAGADIDVLATPDADLKGFHVKAWSDTTAGDTINLVVYHTNSTDSTALLFYPAAINWDDNDPTVWEFDFPNVRVDGFRVDIDPSGSKTSYVNLIIYGWY